ncbi:MAG: 2-oxoacid:ferredoxin oxidoreductase subunit alpha [Planctomycetes bacterium RBG_13_50_24]|nr:MAG: 2-oxoacid:ferredoxin oxidoreductase subunit alpha [Planctomycetes bacterium RBG_13_50_24]
MSKGLSSQNPESVSIVLCGQAGQGIQTVEHLLTRILKIAGFNVFATKEYMSRIRGGMNSTSIRISSRPVRAAVSTIDVLVPLNKGALRHVERNVSARTIILADKDMIGGDIDQTGHRFVDVPFTGTAVEIGDKIYSNVVAVGTLAGLFGVELPAAGKYIEKFFSGKSSDVVQKNLAAIKKGFAFGAELVKSTKINFAIASDAGVEDQVILDGAEAVALGAIAGGCNFIASYPMSPSTGVLAFLARHSKTFDIVAEQAEDEIAAINMALGAWYAGSRAMVTTSGGGFALMIEGVSLAGMLESPMVIHLGQRPGPATGLPTRTEQADLELALYAGHGEFPRIIFAPGTIQDAFCLTQRAFNLADKYQVPVFILTDQYLIDSYYNTAAPDLKNLKIEKHITRTKKDYKRYEFTKSGVSPRGVPGFGDGFVVVDSDEHDAEGHITEDLDLRIRIVDKRLKKGELLKKDNIPLELTGAKNYKNLIVCWGSTHNIAEEAMQKLDRDDVALLHFKQVYPLPNETAEYLQKAEKTIIVENNATSQFAKLIKLHTGIDIDRKILKYNGLSFFVEELAEKLKEALN